MDVDPNAASKTTIDSEWFKWVIHKQGSSIRKLGADKGINRTERTIRRAVENGRIQKRLLEEISRKLDVYPDYLAGRYAWTLKLEIMEEDGVRDYWKNNHLHPSQFPYHLVEQERHGLRKQLLDTLLKHGISEGEYAELNWEQRRKLRRELDRQTARTLSRWFPEHTGMAEDLECYQIMEWQDESDVIDSMFEYLRERGLIEVYDPESDENYISPFEESYKYLPIVSMPTMESIVIKGESGFCSIDEAYSDAVTITPNWINYKYMPCEMSEHNLPTTWAYLPSGLGYRALFDEVATEVADILERDEEPFVSDIGATTFTVTYSNGKKTQREFRLPSDDFARCFALVKKMVPSEEAVPRVLLTSDDT